jgi:hypothetical protein
MERQAGLGKSLEQVLESLTPPDADPAAPGRVLFESEDVEQQLDQLMADIAALRERVQHLVGLVPSDAVLRVVTEVEVDRSPRAAAAPEAKPLDRAQAAVELADERAPEREKKHKKHKKKSKKSKPQHS